MLDQLPTPMPIVRATANQKRLLPPKSNRDTSGKRVVKEVYSERVKVASTATSTWSWRLSPLQGALLLTDAVKDHHGVVHGVTGDGDQGDGKEGVDLNATDQAQPGENAAGDDDVVGQAKQGQAGEDSVVAEADVGRDRRKAHQQRDQTPLELSLIHI